MDIVQDHVLGGLVGNDAAEDVRDGDVLDGAAVGQDAVVIAAAGDHQGVVAAVKDAALLDVACLVAVGSGNVSGLLDGIFGGGQHDVLTVFQCVLQIIGIVGDLGSLVQAGGPLVAVCVISLGDIGEALGLDAVGVDIDHGIAVGVGPLQVSGDAALDHMPVAIGVNVHLLAELDAVQADAGACIGRHFSVPQAGVDGVINAVFIVGAGLEGGDPVGVLSEGQLHNAFQLGGDGIGVPHPCVIFADVVDPDVLVDLQTGDQGGLVFKIFLQLDIDVANSENIGLAVTVGQVCHGQTNRNGAAQGDDQNQRNDFLNVHGGFLSCQADTSPLLFGSHRAP